jgi:ribosomal protein L32
LKSLVTCDLCSPIHAHSLTVTRPPRLLRSGQACSHQPSNNQSGKKAASHLRGRPSRHQERVGDQQEQGREREREEMSSLHDVRHRRFHQTHQTHSVKSFKSFGHALLSHHKCMCAMTSSAMFLAMAVAVHSPLPAPPPPTGVQAFYILFSDQVSLHS